MKKVLVVEDTLFFAKMVVNTIKKNTSFTPVLAMSQKEAEEVLKEQADEIVAGVLDFNLPDAPRGEIIDTVAAWQIPIIVFTADVSDEVRAFVWSKDVAEYVLKSDPHCLTQVCSILDRLQQNGSTKVLVADDSWSFRKVVTQRLKAQRFQILEAPDGAVALKLLDSHPDIKLVITDCHMPKLDGFTLTKKIRERYSRHELAIIGVSSSNEATTASRFLKGGANDYIVKQFFFPEEFYCRVMQSLEHIEHVAAIRDAAIRDALTGLHNRRYFMEEGKKVFAEAMNAKKQISCALLDIDHFKKINDTWGHDAGDIALKKVSSIMAKVAKDANLVARIGGEEFCIIYTEDGQCYAERFLESLRKEIQDTAIEIDNGDPIHATISIGLATGIAESFAEMITSADKLLYQAKQTGRNRLVVEVFF